MNDLNTLQRLRLKVSSLFLNIKAGFDNVDNATLARILREGGIPPYLVSWVASFLGERCNGVLALDLSPRHTTTGRS